MRAYVCVFNYRGRIRTSVAREREIPFRRERTSPVGRTHAPWDTLTRGRISGKITTPRANDYFGRDQLSCLCTKVSSHSSSSSRSSSVPFPSSSATPRSELRSRVPDARARTQERYAHNTNFHEMRTEEEDNTCRNVQEGSMYGRAISDKATLATMLGYEIIMPLGSERKRKDKTKRRSRQGSEGNRMI